MYIGELSKRTGATPKAIRLYEALGLLLRVERKGQYRIYGESDVEFVRLIKEAQALGISLSDLKGLICGRNQLDWQAVIDLLVRKERMINDEIALLSKQKTKVEEYRFTIQTCLDSD